MLALGYLASPAAFAPAYPAARAVAHRRHEPAQAIFGAAPDDDALSMQYAVDVPYKEAAYDPQAADAFYRARPAAVVRRVAQLAQLSGGFVLATLLDKKLDREEQMAELAGPDGFVLIGYWNARCFGDAVQNFYFANPSLCGKSPRRSESVQNTGD